MRIGGKKKEFSRLSENWISSIPDATMGTFHLRITMVILGVDPGTARVGWAVVEIQKSLPVSHDFGCIMTRKTDEPQKRLLLIYNALRRLIADHSPDCIAVEDLFFATNLKTAISVSQSRGMVLLIGAQAGISVVSYTPLAVKRTICGDGHADKTQITNMVMRLLRLRKPPKPDDTADALAIALTHAYSHKMSERVI